MRSSILENITRYSFILLVFILPLWVLPYTAFPLEMNKAFLFYTITIVAAILWFVSIFQKASFRIPKSAILLSVGGIALVWLISSFFSANTVVSLIGGGQETGTFFSFLLLGVSLLLVSVFFQSEARAKSFYLSIFISAFLVFVFQFFHSILNINILPWDIFSAKFSNTIGSWNEVGIFFGFTALTSLILLELSKLNKIMKIFLSAVLAISLISIIFVNFTTIWIVLGVFSLIFLLYLFSAPSPSPDYSATGASSRRFVRFVLPILFLAIFFILGKNMIGDFVGKIGLNPVEVRPSWVATWEVTKKVLKENVVLGSGPNTFVYDWFKFKPAEINYTIFWSSPFQFGMGFIPSFVATSGILGGVAWLVFLILIISRVIKVMTYSENESLRSLLISSFFGSLYLWTFSIIYVPSFTLLSLAFLTTGLFIALLCAAGRINVTELSFANKPKLGFFSSLVIMLLMIVSVASFYMLFQKYIAAYSFGRGLEVFNAGGNADEIESLFSKAARFDPQDKYYRALSEMSLLRIQSLMARTDLPADVARAQFQEFVGNAIGYAQNAIRLNSFDFSNWMSLGKIYEALVPLNVAGSRETAVGAYKDASFRAPFDPRPLFNAARVEIQAKDFASARSFLISALEAKKDYAPAIFLLSQVEVQLGNLDGAIYRTEQSFYLAPNDVGVLFQLGLLYYQKGDFASSRLAFERSVAINPNYSNARYFLGLIYDREGKKDDAIAQFERIRDLNPDNQEVELILSNLAAGKAALEKISPPQPAPEKRKEPPIRESKKDKEL